MPSHKQYEHIEPIEPVSGSEKSRASSGADIAEDIQRSKFESALEKADVSKVERREVAPQPIPVEPSPSQAAKETLMDLAKKKPRKKYLKSQRPRVI